MAGAQLRIRLSLDIGIGGDATHWNVTAGAPPKIALVHLFSAVAIYINLSHSLSAVEHCFTHGRLM